ncbi:type III toxin-antitoxin system ToxN/AbiQ family toxin [Clostridium sp.]|uniref:type III toxin-antitoxin system ToxN/AbiQ family toxin n=1 Tax=Clostridium sp. TaxID=1506 RepID=UPI002905FFE2|nr:type III toxin-antitoxin system ToxN/AbiQ family toxin [Clostridium sp.]MDU4727671.1 type III toxin-antitoxin system ToxN/AbiQ family toxin [Clostridium sp.]
MGLRFYDIDKDYLDYLHNYENKVPKHNYEEHDKFFCGIVLEIENFKYFAPVSSFSIRQATNMLIVDNNEVKGSLRFCFMIPVVDGVIEERDFSKEERKYRDLLEKEYKFCSENEELIREKALKVYKIGTSYNHPLKRTCCDFKKLEEVSLLYKKTV